MLIQTSTILIIKPMVPVTIKGELEIHQELKIDESYHNTGAKEQD